VVNQPVWTGLADLFAGQALIAQGNWEEGVGCLSKAGTFHSAVGLDAFRTHVKSGEAEFQASRGQINDALALVDDAIADTEELAFLKPPTLWQRANVLAQGNADQVSRIRTILENLSLEIATPDEARKLLALKGGDDVAF